MVDIEVLKVLSCYDNSPWGSLSFVIPKKTGDIRIITDFRELNKWVEVDPFLFPIINKILQKLKKFKLATALDLSLSFYLIPLDTASQKLYSIILPWGKYKYLRIPMSISGARAMFQSIMTDTLRDLGVLVYCDDNFVIQGQS